MAYSKKLDTYISPDELAERFKRSCFRDGLEGMEDSLWARIKRRYPNASIAKKDEIYLYLRDKLISDYDIEVNVTVKCK